MQKASLNLIYKNTNGLCVYVCNYIWIPTLPKRFNRSSPNLQWKSTYAIPWNWLGALKLTLSPWESQPPTKGRQVQPIRLGGETAQFWVVQPPTAGRSPQSGRRTCPFIIGQAKSAPISGAQPHIVGRAKPIRRGRLSMAPVQMMGVRACCYKIGDFRTTNCLSYINEFK